MDQENQVATNKCPFCGEEIVADAVKCKHCGKWLSGQSGGSILWLQEIWNIFKRDALSRRPSKGTIIGAILGVILLAILGASWILIPGGAILGAVLGTILGTIPDAIPDAILGAVPFLIVLGIIGASTGDIWGLIPIALLFGIIGAILGVWLRLSEESSSTSNKPQP